MHEQWKPILGYEDCYSISDQGNVVRTRTRGGMPVWKALKPQILWSGYARYTLCRQSIRKDCSAHRLVWEAFNGAIVDEMQINHRNGIKTDNRLCNLEICTQSQNLQHAYRILKIPPPIHPNPGSKNGRAKLTEADIPQIISLYRSGDFTQKEIAKMFGVGPTMVSFIVTGRYWRHVNTAS